MPKRVGNFTTQEIEKIIETFLNCVPWGYFSDIQNHLEEKLGIKFKNSDKDRSGLAHTLKRMQEGKIRKQPKDKDHKYPWYVSLKQSTFDASMDGHLLRTEIGSTIIPSGEFINEMLNVEKIKNLSSDEEFILKHIYRFGFMVVCLLLSSYTRPINQKEVIEKNKERRESWLNNALDFNNKRRSESGFFDVNLKQHFRYDEEKEEIDEDIFKKEFINDLEMQKKVSTMRDTIKGLFPETFESIESVEGTINAVKKNIKENWLATPQEKLPIREF